LFSQVSLDIDVLTEPAGANVYMKEYVDNASEWTFLGVTPLEKFRVPIGIFRWKMDKEGFDEGMVRVPKTETMAGTLDDFFIGRFEVTNLEYKAFLDAGGYQNRAYWQHPFVKDGGELTWEEAASEFIDQSGLPGPSSWMGGDYPRGQDDYPVSGVSWYEAAAYAEYAGMSLPTSTHWDVARGGMTPMIQVFQLGGFAILAPFSNFGGPGPVAVGSLSGITSYGANDMAGNVREWCWNESADGRVIRGGSWQDNTYEFGYERQAPAMDRSPRNGIRLAFYPDPETIPAEVFEPGQVLPVFDVYAQKPVADDIFNIYREQFAYDPMDLNSRVVSRQQSPSGWIHETVEFDAAYGGERVLAHLFLPENVSPPYQTVIYFPGSVSTWVTSSQDMENYFEFTMFLSFLVRNGRAVLYPVYKGTFERGEPALAAIHGGDESYAYTEFMIQTVKDFRRSIDYLETREDIDNSKLAFYGMSWGGFMGTIIPVVEERLRTSIMVAGGLGYSDVRPEANTINYVTRVRIPTLMLNGIYDDGINEWIKPAFELLGTPPADKRLILYETDHIPPRAEYIKESLRWLDKYLGPVK
jgi:formylglycine-generating enzyme required for sulfatase activity/dienelactone hydrolase